MHDQPNAPSSPTARPRAWSAAPAIAIAAALLLTGCVDDPSTQTTEAPAEPTTTSEPTGTVTTSEPPSPTDAPPTAGGQAEVTMESIRFMPNEITVEPGTTITWANQDSVAHTVTARSDNASFESGDMQAGATFQTTLDEPGTYEYVCDYHVGSGMTGTVVVSPA